MPTTRGSGFVNLQQLLGLNQASATQMGQGLAAGITQQGQGFDQKLKQAQDNAQGQPSLQAADPTGYQALAGQAGNIANQAQAAGGGLGGVGALLTQQQQGTGYTGGMSRMDAFLAGQGGGPELARASAGYSGLRDRLGLAKPTATLMKDAPGGPTGGMTPQSGPVAAPAGPTPLLPSQGGRKPVMAEADDGLGWRRKLGMKPRGMGY